MGKPLNQQRRGKGSPVFRAPSHRYKYKVSFRDYDDNEKKDKIRAEVIEFINHPAHTGVVMKVKTEKGELIPLLAPESIAIGDNIFFGKNAEVSLGNVLPLSEIPDGTPIYNIEKEPGDCGRFVKSAGAVAYVVSHKGNDIYVNLPSKKVKIFDKDCRAQIGMISMGGRLEKPMFKAGKKYHMVKSTARYWPHVRGITMNPVDHPYGGSQHHTGRSTATKRTAPPGQKVGLVGAATTGRGWRKLRKRVRK